MNQSNARKNNLRRYSLALLLAGLLTPLAAAHADVWTFNLVNVPSALNEESPGGEFIQMTGGGTFDPDQQTIKASGSAVIFHAGDHPAPPLGTTLRGTWHATGFVSFTEDAGVNGGTVGGSLIFNVTVELALGSTVLEGTMNVMEDGINLSFPGVEDYTMEEGTGSVDFHKHGKSEP